MYVDVCLVYIDVFVCVYVLHAGLFLNSDVYSVVLGSCSFMCLVCLRASLIFMSCLLVYQ